MLLDSFGHGLEGGWLHRVRERHVLSLVIWYNVSGIHDNWGSSGISFHNKAFDQGKR